MTKEVRVRILGALLGIAAAILILTIGFWRTALIALLSGLGWWIAGTRRMPEGLYRLLEKIRFPRD